MRKGLKVALTGVLSVAVLATALPAEVLAGPMSVARPDSVNASAPIDKVWYRRGWGGGWGGGYGGWHGGYYRRGNPGAAIAAGVGLGLLGAGLAASSGGWGGGYGYPYGGYYGGGYGYHPAYYYGGGYGGYGYPYGGGYYYGGW